MNTKLNTTGQLIAATLLAVAGSAFAGTVGHTGDITSDPDTFVTNKSRAAVKADVTAARAAGVTQFVTEGSANAGTAPAFRSTLSRDQVRAEVRNAPRAKVMIYNPAA